MGKTELPSIRISISLIMLFQVSALIIREFARLGMTGAVQEQATAQHVSAVLGFVALGIFMWPLMRGHWMNVRNLFHQVLPDMVPALPFAESHCASFHRQRSPH